MLSAARRARKALHSNPIKSRITDAVTSTKARIGAAWNGGRSGATARARRSRTNQQRYYAHNGNYQRVQQARGPGAVKRGYNSAVNASRRADIAIRNGGRRAYNSIKSGIGRVASAAKNGLSRAREGISKGYRNLTGRAKNAWSATKREAGLMWNGKQYYADRKQAQLNRNVVIRKKIDESHRVAAKAAKNRAENVNTKANQARQRKNHGINEPQMTGRTLPEGTVDRHGRSLNNPQSVPYRGVTDPQLAELNVNRVYGGASQYESVNSAITKPIIKSKKNQGGNAGSSSTVSANSPLPQDHPARVASDMKTIEAAIAQDKNFYSSGDRNYKGKTWETVKTMGKGVADYLSEDPGGIAKGVFKSAAISAAGHAGVAALEGRDPYEAAKTGAFRGAVAGAGYQAFKGATGVRGQGMGNIMGNIKQGSRNVKDVYNLHGTMGDQGVSPALRTLLKGRAGAAFAAQANGLNG
ncbi:MAG: hypothetical protein ACRC5C_11470 [Bacilli bacterium]